MKNPEKGTSLAMNGKWATQLGLDLHMAKREAGTVIPVPCVVHMETGHFAAVLAFKGGMYLLQDPFLGDTWVTLGTLDREASGYALVPAASLGKGWKIITEEEGDLIWGKGAWGPGRPDDTRPDSVKIHSTLALSDPGSIRPAYHADLVSLNLDVPVVSYAPSRGPRPDFTITYNQREYGQPQVFDYCNLGPKWTFSFLACVKDDTTRPDADVTVCNPGGGGLVFHSDGAGAFLPENNTQARLSRLPGNGYLISYPSGRKDYYGLADRAWGLRRVVLTQIKDTFDNTINLGWDALLRVVSVTDAVGKKTSIEYGTPNDPLRISSITDPFGRRTQFQYDESGMLSTLVDSQGKVTTFAYGARPGDKGVPMDFLRSLATPSGGFTFRSGETLVGPSYRRWLEAMGPGGDQERLEAGAGYAYEIAPENLPFAPELDPGYHHLGFRFRESWFWATGAFDPKKPDYHKARHIRWGHGPGGFSSGIVLSQKEPDGPRHWYVHTGDFWGGVFRGARSSDFPLTSADALKPGASIVGVHGTDAAQGLLARVYDGSRALVTKDYWEGPARNPNGISRDYDLEGRLVREISETGGKAEYFWGPLTGDLVQATYPGKHASHRFRFDPNHKLLSWEQDGKSALEFDYLPDGTLKSWKHKNGAPWALHFDSEGRLVSASHSGQEWVFSWDAFNQVKALKVPKGIRGQTEHDSRAEQGQGTHSKAGVSPLARDPLAMGAPLAVPRGCEAAFASLLDGVNGPLIQRLLAQP